MFSSVSLLWAVSLMADFIYFLFIDCKVCLAHVLGFLLILLFIISYINDHTGIIYSYSLSSVILQPLRLDSKQHDFFIWVLTVVQYMNAIFLLAFTYGKKRPIPFLVFPDRWGDQPKQSISRHGWAYNWSDLWTSASKYCLGNNNRVQRCIGKQHILNR